MIARTMLVAALALPLVGAGCRKGTVESYRIPKEKDPEMPMASTGPAMTSSDRTSAPGGPMAASAVPTAQGAELTWTAPAAWKQKSASAMRKGSYAIPGDGAADGDVSVTAFPGDVGGELANVNRWRGQVQLGPITETDLASAVQRLDVNGLPMGVVDVVGPGAEPRRIVGAYVPFGGATWFFKLDGPDAVVAKAKTDFLAFLRTVKPAHSAQ